MDALLSDMLKSCNRYLEVLEKFNKKPIKADPFPTLITIHYLKASSVLDQKSDSTSQKEVTFFLSDSHNETRKTPKRKRSKRIGSCKEFILSPLPLTMQQVITKCQTLPRFKRCQFELKPGSEQGKCPRQGSHPYQKMHVSHLS